MDGSRILVAMSGGVDSSVAAALLVEQGHDVVGVTMKTFCYSGTPAHSKTCCGLDGITDARRVADTLGIPHFVFDVESEFTRDVIDDFVEEYAAGRTPNPCVRCNSNTKFRDLLARGEQLGCAGIATGHYVRMDHGADPPALLRGADPDKDQSYFLWGLPPSLLPRLHFPVGELSKAQVRTRARELGLVTAEKPESQEICFVPTGDYRDLLRSRLDERHPALRPGPIVDRTGRVLGEHEGYASYTVGQRRGFGGGFPEPMYVLAVRPDSREVVIGPRSELDSAGMWIDRVHWLAAPENADAGRRIDVQIRYRAAPVPARVTERGDGVARIDFDRPQRAVTPGQSAVLFDGSRVLGGGRIRHTRPTGAAEVDEGSKASPATRDLLDLAGRLE